MSPLALHVLRRLAALLLVLTGLLLVTPRALVELGLVGPDADEEIARAHAGLRAAETYGGASLPSFVAARNELQSAERLARSGDRRAARHAAVRAAGAAADAQREALARRVEAAARAEKIIEDIDRDVNGLEKAYAEVSAGRRSDERARLVSALKKARATAATLALAYEEEDYERVLREGQAVRAALEATHRTLLAARR